MSRFVFSDKNIQKGKHRPKPSAFIPPSDRKLSVVHTSGLSDAEIWTIGKQTLGGGISRGTIYARADVHVQSLLEVELRAIRDDKPFKRHTSVIGWPSRADEGETKALWKQIALTLSEDARLTLVIPAIPIVRS